MDTAQLMATTIRVSVAAQQTRIPERTLRDWIATGRLPAVRVGGRLRVRPDDLDKLSEPVVRP